MELVKRDGGWYLGVKIKDNIIVSCGILHPDGIGIRRCVNCNFVPEMLRKLECQHELCEHCYETITSYTCQLHGIRTRKKKVSEPRHNTDLDGVILACPRCAALKTYSAMTEHLLRKHNNLLMNSDCDDSTPLASTGEGDGDRQNDTVSRFEICPYSFKAWEKQEIKEHVFDCSEEITECPECLEHIKKGDYEEHVIQCRIKDEEKKAGGCARVKEEEDGKSEDKKRDDDIQELETKIQGQNINYKFRTVMCPLCEQEVSRKALAEHLNDTCEQRFLKCRYCSLDVEACHLQDHMDVCEEMPATCNHCKREFNTFAELRDEHLAVCPLKPMKCPYYRLGCNFQATNKEMEKHTASCKRVTSFVDRFLDLEEKLLDARAGYDELRRRTSETEKAFRELRLENEGLRKMISKNEEVNQIVQNRKMQNRTMQNDPMTEKRLRELEEKHALLETPLEKLLVEIAKTK